MKQFYTAKAHSKPKKVKLYNPDGSPTDYYLMVLGCESSAVRSAKTRVHKEKFQNDISQDYALNIIISAMIDDWNLEKECNEENKLELLEEAPQIGDAVFSFSSTHANFTKK